MINYIEKYCNALENGHGDEGFRQQAKECVFEKLQEIAALKAECESKNIDFAGHWPGLAADLRRYAALFTDDEYLDMCIEGGKENWKDVDPEDHLNIIRGREKQQP